jgi:hypothetical protein
VRPAVFLAAALLAACGYIGPPLPPALHIPQRVEDLRAIEYGPNILVQFTLPALTTDNLPLENPRSVDLYIGPADAPFNVDAWAASAQRFQIPASGPGPLRHEAPAQPWIGRQVTIAVRSTGRTGRVSDWSPFVILSVDPPLARPEPVEARNVARGVELRWTAAAPRYRVMRAVGGETAVSLLGESEAPEYLDESTVYGTRYTYVVIGVNGATQQSLPSEPVSITPVDVFPPAAPTGLSAVPGPQSIELSWARNTEPDFAGYNLFRSVDGGPFEKLPVQLDAPAYSDTAVAAGRRYAYTVESVDTNGNVSARSPVVEAAIP